jgi:hypothetical protein
MLISNIGWLPNYTCNTREQMKEQSLVLLHRESVFDLKPEKKKKKKKAINTKCFSTAETLNLNRLWFLGLLYQ